MADNVGYTPGAGAVIAADDIGGVLHQRVKLGVGADGVAVDVSASNPLPVTGNITAVLDGVTEEAPLPVHDETAHHILTRLLQYMNAPQGYDKAQQRQRGTVVVESGTVTTVTTVSTVTTVATVSNISSVGGYSAQMQIMDTNRTAWAQCVRARIS